MTMNTIEREEFIKEQLKIARQGRVPAPKVDANVDIHRGNNGICFSIIDDDAPTKPPPFLPRLQKGGVMRNVARDSAPPPPPPAPAKQQRVSPTPVAAPPIRPAVPAPAPVRQAAAAPAPARPARAKPDVVRNIEVMEERRAERRRRAAEAKSARADDTRAAEAAGVGIECVDFLRLLAAYRDANGLGGDPVPWAFGADVWAVSSPEAHAPRIRVCVRKRPMLKPETLRHDFDVVDVVPGAAEALAAPESLVVHEPKCRVDLSKAVDSHAFRFDGAFGESDGNDRIYSAAVRPMLEHVAGGGVATVFAFGQTGSGKTCTMAGHGDARASDGNAHGLYALAARDVMGAAASAGKTVHISFYEIYGGNVLDLLGERARREVQEDAHGHIVVAGLVEVCVASAEELLHYVEAAQQRRATGCTSANETSSRSHAVLTVVLRAPHSARGVGSTNVGKLNLVDLAGSERASDSTSKDRQTRLEGAEINKSLLCLKECIRALDAAQAHVPFRGSKLTLVLRDSFVGDAKTLMIATVAPGAAAAEHTLNTLRYAQRVRDFSAKRPALPAPAARCRRRRAAGKRARRETLAEGVGIPIPSIT